MRVEFTGDIDDQDIVNARRAAEALRPLVREEAGGTVTVQTDAGAVALDSDLLRSVTKIVEMVSATPDLDPEAEISPQEAALLLRMSRPSVMRLIEKGHLGARKVNTHHRLSKAEVVRYKREQAAVRRKSLAEAAQISEEYDF